MTTRNRITLLCAIALVAVLILGCDDFDGTGDAKWGWQREVNSRQRGIERPTATVVAERGK